MLDRRRADKSMSFVTRLALSQLRENPIRSLWLLAGISFSASILTIIYTFAYKSAAMLVQNRDETVYITTAAEFQSILTIMNWVVAFLTFLVIAFTVLMLLSAFRMGINERVERLSILRNIGITRRQVRHIFATETLILFSLGILIGSAAGKIAVNFGIRQVNLFLQPLEAAIGYNLTIYPGVSWFVFLLLALVLSFPVITSSLLAAAEVMHILKGAEKRRMHERRYVFKKRRTERLMTTFFGYKGTIVSRLCERSKYSIYVVATSLAVSIVLVVSADALGVKLRNTAALMMVNAKASDLDYAVEALYSMEQAFMMFVLVFVALLLFLGVSSAISTIFVNARMHTCELVTMRSIGVDDKGIQRTLSYRSIMCSVKALLIGLPAGVLASYAISLSTKGIIGLPYRIPWLAVILCISGALLIAWLAAHIAMRQLRNLNMAKIGHQLDLNL